MYGLSDRSVLRVEGGRSADDEGVEAQAKPPWPTLRSYVCYTHMRGLGAFDGVPSVVH